MIKLIASDIDGTLVVEGTNHINQEVFDVILKLKEKGVYFAAASGRQAPSIEHLFEPIKDRIFYLAENGAYVGSYGRILFTTPLDRRVVRDLICESRRVEGCSIVLGAPRISYTDTRDHEFVDWMEKGYNMKIKRVEDVLDLEEDVVKVSFYRTDRIEELLTTVMPRYEGIVKYTISGDPWLDCTAPGVNKGSAIRLLQESLGISKEETMAFGDQLNDIEMMGQAYHSYAVGNARKEVKEAARYVADTNVNDGVLKVLKSLL